MIGSNWSVHKQPAIISNSSPTELTTSGLILEGQSKIAIFTILVTGSIIGGIAIVSWKVVKAIGIVFFGSLILSLIFLSGMDHP